ncbi:solute carrier family 35 member F3 [Lepisosteus oculatus]|uniref:solute carrier family 35 member F3 n=1 Tax=Lepisosteus oculatus TaxID=7918 RepID=UPI0035F52FBC
MRRLKPRTHTPPQRGLEPGAGGGLSRSGRADAMHRLTARVSPAAAATGPAFSLAGLRAKPDDPQQEGDPGSAPAGSEAESSSSNREGDGGGRGAGCPARGLRRLAWGALLGGGVALSWAGATHSARRALQRLPAPFFVTWFAGTWNLLFFPLYYGGHLLGADARQWPWTRFRQCSRVLGEEGVTVRLLLRKAAPFGVLWSLTTYLYLLALLRISSTDASAVLCCSQPFVFLLSWIGLKDRFLGIRIVAAILSITGIVMMAYADGFHSDSITGVALAVGSASSSALYKVLFRLLGGDLQQGEVAVLLSCVGLCGTVLLAWICVLLYLTHVEYWPSAQHLPWDLLCTLSSLLLSFNMLVHFGTAVTHPSLIALGFLLSVPANAAIDLHMNSAQPLSQERLAASGTIGAGFLLLLLPEEWDESALRWLARLRAGRRREETAGAEEGGEGATPSRAKIKLGGASALA